MRGYRLACSKRKSEVFVWYTCLYSLLPSNPDLGEAGAQVEPCQKLKIVKRVDRVSTTNLHESAGSKLG